MHFQLICFSVKHWNKKAKKKKKSKSDNHVLITGIVLQSPLRSPSKTRRFENKRRQTLSLEELFILFFH